MYSHLLTLLFIAAFVTVIPNYIHSEPLTGWKYPFPHPAWLNVLSCLPRPSVFACPLAYVTRSSSGKCVLDVKLC